MENAISAGQSMAETVATCADMTFRHQGANAEPHRRNVESVYAELGGDADAAQVGWNRSTQGEND